jgi:hypothetical protein
LEHDFRQELVQVVLRCRLLSGSAFQCLCGPLFFTRGLHTSGPALSQPATRKRDGVGVVALGHEPPPLFGELVAGHVKCLVVQEELSFEVAGLSLAARADSLSLRKSASMKAAGEYMHRMHLTFSINKKGDTWKR